VPPLGMNVQNVQPEVLWQRLQHAGGPDRPKKAPFGRSCPSKSVFVNVVHACPFVGATLPASSATTPASSSGRAAATPSGMVTAAPRGKKAAACLRYGWGTGLEHPRRSTRAEERRQRQAPTLSFVPGIANLDRKTKSFHTTKWCLNKGWGSRT
jgi:hypothetical protein